MADAKKRFSDRLSFWKSRDEPLLQSQDSNGYVVPAPPVADDEPSRSISLRGAIDVVRAAVRLRSFEFLAPQTPSRLKSLRRAVRRTVGIDSLTSKMRSVRGKPPKLNEALGEFLKGSELSITAHVRRAERLIVGRKWADATMGKLRDLTAEEVYHNISKSVDVLNMLLIEMDLLDHRNRQVLTTLRARREAYVRWIPQAPELRVLVLGGGPIGFRTAIEMALLGHKVRLIEKRDSVTRLNVLKLWEETNIDLDRLGLKAVDASYSNQKAGRASTGRLQLALCKVALLLGVKVEVDESCTAFSLKQAHKADVLFVATGFNQDLYDRFRSEAVAASRHWGTAAAAASPFSPQPEGKAPAAAIAVVAHFERSSRTKDSAAWVKAYEAFDWTVQDARGAETAEGLGAMRKKYGMFCVPPSALEKEGILLENIITYQNKGGTPPAIPPSYYFIFTLRSEMLKPDHGPWNLIRVGEGAPEEGGSRALLEWAKSREAKRNGLGVDEAELSRLAKRVVGIFTAGYTTHKVGKAGVVPGGTAGKPLSEACSLLREVTSGFDHSLDLFDFSERHCMVRAAEVVTAVDGEPRRPLLVQPVGDALQEPFWPEGLGVNRGSHNALDACWVAHKWGEVAGDEAGERALVEERQALYEKKTLQMHGKNRAMLCGYRSDNSKSTAPAPAHEYSPDPASRYN